MATHSANATAKVRARLRFASRAHACGTLGAWSVTTWREQWPSQSIFWTNRALSALNSSCALRAAVAPPVYGYF